MNKGRSYLGYGAIGLIILCFALAASYLENKVPAAAQGDRTTLTGRESDQSAVAQRRGAIGTAAVADATVQ
ncbi:hypothetical protein [Sphingomonas jatrophae]|uniref:Uncharacterized protein n=1 Tax=Sphingomonas jatrophae TaxID=1166337 RepID=A0A1I6JH93_9SPHN|nr:hypothetical protein [Sphingomonas jatrophae]SFR78229.1 hypothetical protein SAMN05192580_0259 [Sphingomonas jatrophae]